MMEKHLVALALAGVVDAISYMVVSPSIVFYVLENGGSKEQYGLILSAFSFASFCAKPLLGWWSDGRGFRVPYMVSLGIATLGGFVYTLASALPTASWRIHAILLSRLLGGVGAANSSLGFAYVAHVTPHDKMTSVNSLLSMVRILGMAAGPGVNVFLRNVDVTVAGGLLTLDPLNSVGLLLMGSNLLAMAFIAKLLDEPPTEEVNASLHSSKSMGDHDSPDEEPTRTDIGKALLSADILIPILSIFTFNANFQLIETGLAPAASDALGWGPVATSTALGSMSFVIMFNMLLVFKLSKYVPDPVLLIGGHACSAVAYGFMWFLWRRDAHVWQFVLPMFFGAGAFPFLGAPTRSMFTHAVDRAWALDKYHGTMQAVLSMFSSVAGFVTPGLVATFCLRHPDTVTASESKRELSSWTLFATVLSLSCIVGVAYIFAFGETTAPLQADEGQDMKEPRTEIDEEASGVTMTETSALLQQKRSQSLQIPIGVDRRTRQSRSMSVPNVNAGTRPRKFRPSLAAHRASSVTMMGLTQPSDHDIKNK